MLDQPRYEHVEPARFWRGEDRCYRMADGSEYPGVTTILGKTRKDTPGLARWKKNATPEQLAEAERKRDAGAVRGSLLHTFIEEYLIDGLEGEGPYWESIYPFLKTVEKVHLIESAVCHPLVEAAGTLDLFGVVQGENEVVDWKTADKPKKRAWIEDYLIQLATYTACLRYKYGKVVSRGRVVIAIPDQEAQQFVLEGPELQKYWNKFRHRRDLYRLLTGT